MTDRLTALALPGIVSETGLAIKDGLAFDEWVKIGSQLRSLERSVMWWLGDWLRYGERSYGEKYTEAIEVTDYSYQTVRDAAWMAGEYDLSRRRDSLTWSHHKEVANLESPEQDELLERAEANGWSTRELREEVNRRKNAAAIGVDSQADTCTVQDLNVLAGKGRKFGTIYADPPWLYGNQGTRAATGNHYGGMTIDEIKALPIEQLAGDNAHLHLWTTNAFLFDCKAIMEAWGFEYKSCFVWVKPQMGIGNYWRVSHEFMLFGLRGKCPFMNRAQMSWMNEPRGRHSAKPEKVRSIIEKTSPGPYLELFGRHVARGWTVWGNQIDRTLLDSDVAEVVA